MDWYILVWIDIYYTNYNYRRNSKGVHSNQRPFTNNITFQISKSFPIHEKIASK